MESSFGRQVADYAREHGCSGADAVRALEGLPDAAERAEFVRAFALSGQEALAEKLVESGATIAEAQVALLRDARIALLAAADFKTNRAKYERTGRTAESVGAFWRAVAEGKVGRPYGKGRPLTDSELNQETRKFQPPVPPPRQVGRRAVSPGAARSLSGVGHRARAGTEAVPEAAYRLSEPETSTVEITGTEDAPRFHLVAYSGGIIPKHWAWGNLALDLTGMVEGRPEIPVLREHFSGAIVGHADKVTAEGQLVIEGPFNLVTKDSIEVYELCKAGHPWQASLYFAEPRTIERVAEGKTAKVNGRTLTGPGTVMRKWRLREASFCTLAADENTEGTALAGKVRS